MIKKEFKTFKEFCQRADEILEDFEVVSLSPFFSLRESRNYIYSINATAKEKDLMWEMLMGDISIEELLEYERR